MGWFSKKETSAETTINWKQLNTEQQLKQIIEESYTIPVALFKHSTRCSISSMAKTRLERAWDLELDQISIYYLDLLAYRNVSDAIAATFDVAHQSPQLILVKNGKVVYHASHSSIAVEKIKTLL
ncbi:MAG: bacillithiol system redox-active protein YtxJ [Flavobacteriales bacterium]|jgi:bacillithiol system protein YtxJ|nr:bacillithiol system redox-active protein YtxJ [Flavobacteriales bacterium]